MTSMASKPAGERAASVRLAAQLVALHKAAKQCTPGDGRLVPLAEDMLPLLVQASGLRRLQFKIFHVEPEGLGDLVPLVAESDVRVFIDGKAIPLGELAKRENPSAHHDRLQAALDLTRSPGQPVDRYVKDARGCYPTIWDQLGSGGMALRLAAAAVLWEEWLDQADWIENARERFLEGEDEPFVRMFPYAVDERDYRHEYWEHQLVTISFLSRAQEPTPEERFKAAALEEHATRLPPLRIDGWPTLAACRKVLLAVPKVQLPEPKSVPFRVLAQREKRPLVQELVWHLALDESGPKMPRMEVAKTLGLSRTAVDNHLQRARQRRG